MLACMVVPLSGRAVVRGVGLLSGLVGGVGLGALSAAPEDEVGRTLRSTGCHDSGAVSSLADRIEDCR